MRRGLGSCGTPLSGNMPPPLVIVASTFLYPVQRSMPPWASRILPSSSFMICLLRILQPTMMARSSRIPYWLCRRRANARARVVATRDSLVASMLGVDGSLLRLPDVEALFCSQERAENQSENSED